MDIVYGLVGGLGLFLFGMRNMSEGLQKVAGDRLKRLLEVLTTNRILGVLVGALITALVQSSSTTTVMVVGFVNAGLMTLGQAVGVIMGANIGTTVTAQIIAFDLADYALPAIGLGVAMSFFGRRAKARNLGQVIMSFGVLFLGLEIMKDTLKPLRGLPAFRDLTLSFAQHPIKGVFAGTLMTVAVQSSSASIGLLQSLAAEKLISIQSALPVLFGDNIGTTVTAVLASIGTSVTAKRAAGVHVIFNIIGTVLVLLALPFITPIVVATSGNVVRQIANAHTLFNVSNTLLQLPFSAGIVALVLRLIPGEDTVAAQYPQHLDVRLLETPAAAISQVVAEVRRMSGLAKDVVTVALEGFFTGDEKKLRAALETEKAVNTFNHEITRYLTEITKRSLSDEQGKMVRSLYYLVADIERVGDHGENLADLAQFRQDRNLPFSETAVLELRELEAKVLEAYDTALQGWDARSPDLARQVFDLEQQIDAIEEDYRERHIERLNSNGCHPSSGVVYLDMISNLERIADHAASIAGAVVND